MEQKAQIKNEARETRDDLSSVAIAKGERRFRGSAIILAIVLTSLLAIIGVMFLLSSRVESVATSAVSENKDLTLAVDTVVAKISEDLVYDVSRGSIDPNQYADYPDPCNPFLASLEPYYSLNYYWWSRISDPYGILESLWLAGYKDVFNDFAGANNLRTRIVLDAAPVTGTTAITSPRVDYGGPADADGDGVADSRWVKIPSMTSSKGKPIFAAIRVIDNGGMLNVNTGFKFDPCNSAFVDGSSQTQINLYALSNLDQTHLGPGEKESRLLSYRSGSADANFYEQNVVWQYGLPIGVYTPFDISDELVLRNRYILNNDQMTTRIENLWADSFKDGLEQPISAPSEINSAPRYWVHRVGYDSSDPCIYDYRHIATTYNYDRIIVPDGNKMFNINKSSQTDSNYIRGIMTNALIEGGALPATAEILGAQITANLIDYVDTDSNVTVVYEPNGVPHYGFEQPCIYISELAQNFFRDANDPNIIYSSYAIELFKPYLEDIYPQCPIGIDCPWQVIVNTDAGGIILPVNWTSSSPFYVIVKDDFGVIDVNLADANGVIDPNTVAKSNILDFNSSNLIELQRRVYDPCISNYTYVTVDKVTVPVSGANDTNWLKPQTKDATHSFQRDIFPNKPIRQLWDKDFGFIDSPTLGSKNNFASDDTRQIQAHPGGPFTNVGEFGQIFYNRSYQYNYGGILFTMPPEGVTEPEMRINLADANLPYQKVFKYLTVMDPLDHGWPGETRIKGRININTAPWYVLAQLPWISYKSWDLARSIADYRENIGGFRSVGELMNVVDSNISPGTSSIAYYADKAIPVGLLTPPDGAGDTFEQRDSIFARISNLVTVRSDVFTAYILVRIGIDGPQKRAIAILDRSEVPNKPVKIVAIQMVPDPH